MELQPDPYHEGGLVARADAGEQLIARTKSFEGAGLADRRPSAVFLRGAVVAEMVLGGENLEAVQEKLVKKIIQEQGEPSRTVTLIDGVVALVPVYNEKIRKEELLPAKNNELIEGPTADVEAPGMKASQDLVELPVAESERYVA